MKIEQSWKATSKGKEIGKNNELVRLACQWDIGVEVNITNPYEYIQGPVEIKTKEEKKEERTVK